MIQFNLLPDIKLEFIKARRTKHLVMIISLMVSAVTIFVMLLSFVTVDVVQKKSLHDLDRDISTYNGKLEGVPNLDKILTVQNQLNTLTSLHDQKPVTSRLFGYLSQLTPNGVTISSFQIDFTLHTISISGGAPSLDLVNKFADTLKATDYAAYTTDSTGQAQQQTDENYYNAHGSYPANEPPGGVKPAFSSVVLSSFNKADSGASYTLDMSFDATIFSGTSNVVLHVPSGTVSNTSVLFKGTGS